MKTPDIIGGGIGITIGAYVLIAGFKMPPDLVMKIGPSFFPNMLAIGLISFSVLLVILGIVDKKGGGFEPINFHEFGIWRAMIALGASLLFALLLKPLGFIPVTIMLVLGLMYLLGSRKKLELVLAPVGIALAVWFVFEKLLTISLPGGILSGLGF